MSRGLPQPHSLSLLPSQLLEWSDYKSYQVMLPLLPGTPQQFLTSHSKSQSFPHQAASDLLWRPPRTPHALCCGHISFLLFPDSAQSALGPSHLLFLWPVILSFPTLVWLLPHCFWASVRNYACPSAVFEVDNQQGPTVLRSPLSRELCSVS